MPERNLSFELSHDPESDQFVLSIREVKGRKEKEDHYILRENPNTDRAFMLGKVVRKGEERVIYHVHLREGTCDCRGFEAWQHCKHVQAVAWAEEELAEFWQRTDMSIPGTSN